MSDQLHLSDMQPDPDLDKIAQKELLTDLTAREKQLKANIAALEKKLNDQKQERAKESGSTHKNKIGARQDGSFKAISTAPSINKTPVGSSMPPLPYPTIQDLADSVSVVDSVRFNGKPAYVLDQSKQPSCKGDDAGTGGGIRSGTVNGEVKPVKGSGTVRVGGKPIIREGDPCTMNGGNNPGVYVTTQKPSATSPSNALATSSPPVKPQTKLEAKMLAEAKIWAKEYKENYSKPLHDAASSAIEKGGAVAAVGAQTAAVGGVIVATGIGAAPGATIAAAGGVIATAGEATATGGVIVDAAATAGDAAADFTLTGKTPNVGPILIAFTERVLLSKLDKLRRLIPGRKAKTKTGHEQEAEPQAGGDGVTIVGNGIGNRDDCGIKPYKDQKCPKGQDRHHIVPDYALRYGNRKDSASRIPGMPSFNDGPSICLTGKDVGTTSEHARLHERTDPRIADAGRRSDNGPSGAATIGEIIEISVEEAGNIKPNCKDELKQKVDAAFKDVDRNKYGRTTQQLPKGDARTTLESGAKERRRLARRS